MSVSERNFAKPEKRPWFGLTRWRLPGAEHDLRSGDVVDVLWPNGNLTVEVLEGRPASRSVYDQGSMYPSTVNGEELFITKWIHGAEAEVRLESLQLCMCERG